MIFISARHLAVSVARSLSVTHTPRFRDCAQWSRDSAAPTALPADKVAACQDQVGQSAPAIGLLLARLLSENQALILELLDWKKF